MSSAGSDEKRGPGETQTVGGGARGHLVSQFHLTVTDGPDAGAAFASRGGRVVVGTHPSAQLVLKDATVSRFHCELAIVGGHVELRDLGSRNGTTVNGVSVVHGHLRGGETIAIGETRLRFAIGDAFVELEASSRESFGAMVGKSVGMRAAFSVLERAAETDATVLLEGETGTGKELAAEALHAASARCDAPFIVVDCSAIPPDLMESELFGHEKGAFTGAVAARQGAFEAAAGGTVFLDEVGELPLDLQPKLLRALERREIKRVGSTKYVGVDFRVVAATNRDLRAEVNARRFRPDLYYRLAVVEVRLPPLRERAEDLALLLERILGQLGAGRDDARVAALRKPEFVAELARHEWPGNVRELRNFVERCLTLRRYVAPGEPRTAPAHAAPAAVDASKPLREAREAFERAYVEAVLRANDGNATAAARAAGLDRAHFYRLLWKFGLR